MKGRNWLRSTLTVLAVAFFTINCSSGSSGNGGGGCAPTDPACNPPPQIQITLLNPIDGLTIAEGDTIFCDGSLNLTPPAPLSPDWWLKGDKATGANDWLKARGDSIRCACAPVGGIASAHILKFSAGGHANPPPGDYTVTLHARVTGAQDFGPIVATENRALHIVPRDGMN